MERQTMQQQDLVSFVREGLVWFTAEQAATVLSECRYRHQRNELSAMSHINTLAKLMRDGEWLSKSQLDFASIDGILILLNGHHRMHAQVASGENILWSIVIHECASEDQVRKLYTKFDTYIRVRSGANEVNGLNIPEMTGLSKMTATSLYKAAPVIINGMRFKPTDIRAARILDSEKERFCLDYKSEAKFYEDVMVNAHYGIKPKFRSVSIFAVALVTLRHSRARAEEFWAGVFEDDGLTKGDPRKALLLDMQNRNSKNSLNVAMMMATARCWNAWWERKNISHVKVTGNNVPILGTPHTVWAQ